MLDVQFYNHYYQQPYKKYALIPGLNLLINSFLIISKIWKFSIADF